MANKKKKASSKSRQVAKKAINSKIAIEGKSTKKKEEKKVTKTTNFKKDASNKPKEQVKKVVKKSSSSTNNDVKKSIKNAPKKGMQNKNVKKETVEPKKKKTVKVVTPKEELIPVIENVKKKVEPVQQKLSLPEIETKKEVIKNKKESKKYIILFLVALLSIILFLVVTSINKKRSITHIEFDKISFNSYLNLYESKKSDLSYIYITIDNCIGCNQYEEKLDKLRSEYNIVIKELDITDLKESDLDKLKNSNIFIADSIEVPVLLSIKDGKEINGISGNRDYQALKNFVEYSKKPANNTFSKISVNKYISLLNGKETSVVYIGESTNTNCQKFASTLESVAGKKGIKVNYLNTEEILSEDNWKKLEESNDLFSKTWFVPAILIVKDGNIKDYRMEDLSGEELLSFFNRNGL